MIFTKKKGTNDVREIIAIYRKLSDGTVRSYTAVYRGARLLWEAALRVWKGKQVWKGKETWKY